MRNYPRLQRQNWHREQKTLDVPDHQQNHQTVRGFTLDDLIRAIGRCSQRAHCEIIGQNKLGHLFVSNGAHFWSPCRRDVVEPVLE